MDLIDWEYLNKRCSDTQWTDSFFLYIPSVIKSRARSLISRRGWLRCSCLVPLPCALFPFYLACWWFALQYDHILCNSSPFIASQLLPKDLKLFINLINSWVALQGANLFFLTLYILQILCLRSTPLPPHTSPEQGLPLSDAKRCNTLLSALQQDANPFSHDGTFPTHLPLFIKR